MCPTSLTTRVSCHSREGERVGKGHKQRHSSSSKCLLSSPTLSSRAGKFYFLWVGGMRWGEEEELTQQVLIQIYYFCQELRFEGQKLWVINNYVCSFFLEAVKVEYLVCLCMCVCMCVRGCAESLHSCPTLCHPVDCSPPGSSVHGILQAGIPEWVAMFSSRGSSWLRDRTRISYIYCIGRWVLYQCHLGSPSVCVG